MAIIRRKKNADAMIRRAHLGNIDNAEEVLNLARQNGIRTTPLDVEGLMKLLDVSVQYREDLDNDVSGHLKKTENGWVCSVNSKHHPTRQRFTLAHELAHFILHRNDQSEFIDHTYFRTSDAANSMEHEANSFAGHLLMPEEDFRFFIRNVSADIDIIAEHFGVSPVAVRVRAKQFGFKEGK